MNKIEKRAIQPRKKNNNMDIYIYSQYKYLQLYWQDGYRYKTGRGIYNYIDM